MPTQAEIQATISAANKVFNDLFTTSSTTFTDDSEDLKGTYKDDFDFLASMQIALDTARSDLSAVINDVGAVLAPMFDEYARLEDTTLDPDKIPWPNTGIGSIFDRLTQWMVDEDLGVVSRVFTFGAIGTITDKAGSAITGVGDIFRIDKDKYEFGIETAFAETVEARCTVDANAGASIQQETFELRGESPALDSTVLGGSGLIVPITGLSCADSQSFISNPSFTSYAGTLTAVTDLTGWTMVGSPTVFSKINIDTTTTYRTFSGEGTTPASLKFIADDGVKQTWTDRSLSFSDTTPYYVHVASYHTTGTVATLTLTWGSVSVATTLDGSNKDQWNLTRIGGTSTTQEQCWFRNFDKNDGELKIEVSGLSGSEYVLVDDVTIGPMQQFGIGEWYALVGGPTPFLDGNKTSWATTGGTSGINQRWFAEAFGRYLPHYATGTDETWDDPS